MTSTFDSVLPWAEGQNESRPAENAMDKRGKRGKKKIKQRKKEEVLQLAQNKTMKEER